MSKVDKNDKKHSGSEWLVMNSDGSIVEAEKFNWSKYDDLRTFFMYESSGSREAKQAPAHVAMMRKLELVDYEPAADAGNFRWLPKGHLMKRLMENYASSMVRNYGGMQVESPIMYDLQHPQLAQYLKRFPARQYHLLSGEKKYFLRFAACFGQYMIMRDMNISYAHLPVRIYELSHYSFRREQGGELAGLRRLRSFTMPDMHTLCADVEQSKEEFYCQFLLCKQWMKSLGLNHVMAIRVVSDFFEQNKDFLKKIAKDFGQPILLEKWEERKFYFILKFEFNVVDGQKKAAALSTVQIDVENAERFGINYINKEGNKQNPLLLHASISGSIDRNLYAILEQEARKLDKNDVQKFAYWLAPTQVILAPVAERHVPYCQKVASSLQKIARVEVDDRNESIGKKIRSAEVQWIPFIIVIGDVEEESGKITVRERGVKEQKVMSISEFSEKLKKLQGEKPFETISWPMLVSKQPKFI